MKHPYVNIFALVIAFFNAKYDFMLGFYAIGIGVCVTHILAQQNKADGIPIISLALLSLATFIGGLAGSVSI